MASVLKVDKLDPQSGTALEIGTSGDTITVPSGATFAVSGTMNASSITAGTVATARLGSGTASSSTVLYGDQTYKAEPGGGKVLQVVTAISEVNISTSSDAYTDSGVSCAITPAATSSKVLVMWNQGRAFMNVTQEMFCAVYVDIGGGGYSIIKDIVELRMNVPTGGGTLNLLHSPSTTSEVTYKMYYKRSGGTGTVYFHNGSTPPPNTFVLMEIGA